ncbi:transcriptional regulator [Blastochloris viridis]|uniref:Transcriptional regulator n=1 Tax=Blastochloris viridis TaxID=1079 RepID=A0A182D0C9_BLAVI|nr:transcriptional regulator [Blastochloris viridis]
MRFELDLTLDDLACRAGIDLATLSDIETGNVCLTGRFVRRLSVALGVRMVDLMLSAAVQSRVSPRAEQSSWRDPETAIVRRRLTPDGVGALTELVEIEYPPGAACDYRDPPFESTEHQVLVLDGRLELAIDDGASLTAYALDAGDCIHVPRGCGMMVSNPYQRSARFIVSISSI